MSQFSHKLWPIITIILTALTKFKVSAGEDSSYGVLFAKSTESDQQGLYCIMYNPQFRSLPPDRQTAPQHPLKDFSKRDFCEMPQRPLDVAGDAVALARGNCTFAEKAAVVQKLGGEAAIVISEDQLFIPVANQSSDYNEINITVAVIAANDFQSIKSYPGKVLVQIFAPPEPWMDYNMILIWTIAMTTLVIGAFWSGHVKQKELMRKRGMLGRGDSAAENEVSHRHGDEDEQETLDVSPKVVFIFVVLMCAMLVSLYFLYDYLVYVIIGLFCVASSVALYSCLKPLLIRMPCCRNLKVPPNKIPLLSKQPEIRRILLYLACAAVAVWWGVERHAWYAWILQDILGFVFCVHMMKTARLSSLKICTFLLVLLFLYDIFFVFITPLFTKSGQSVMVDVATGGGSSTGEMLPMVLKVPRLSNPTMSVCAMPFSLLGFGDILIPGLLVSYCHGFDLKVNTGRVYFFATVVAYGVGLVITFVALALMSQGQPALLYLVPCTLLTTVVMGLCRGELKHLWFGEPCSDESDPSSQIANPVEEPSVEVPRTQNLSGPEASEDAANNSSLESDSEQQLLIAR